MATKWKEVGIHLGVPVDQLDAIQLDNRGGIDTSQNCLNNMFIWWLRSGKEKTVDKLITAVHAVGRHDVEKKINEVYGEWMNTITTTSY